MIASWWYVMSDKRCYHAYTTQHRFIVFSFRTTTQFPTQTIQSEWTIEIPSPFVMLLLTWWCFLSPSDFYIRCWCFLLYANSRVERGLTGGVGVEKKKIFFGFRPFLPSWTMKMNWKERVEWKSGAYVICSLKHIVCVCVHM